MLVCNLDYYTEVYHPVILSSTLFHYDQIMWHLPIFAHITTLNVEVLLDYDLLSSRVGLGIILTIARQIWRIVVVICAFSITCFGDLKSQITVRKFQCIFPFLHQKCLNDYQNCHLFCQSTKWLIILSSPKLFVLFSVLSYNPFRYLLPAGLCQEWFLWLYLWGRWVGSVLRSRGGSCWRSQQGA